MVGAKFSEEGKLKKENLKSYLKARVPHSQNGLHHHHQEIQHLHLPPPPGLRPPGHPRRRKVLPREAGILGNGHTGEAHGTLPRVRPQPRENEALARVQLLDTCAGGGEDIRGNGSEVARGDGCLLMVYNK